MFILSTESLPHYGVERVFDFAKKAGFDGVNIAVGPNLDTQSPKYLKQLEERYSLPIKAFSLVGKGEEERFEIFQRTVREFSGTTIIVNPPKMMAFKYKTWVTDVVPRLAQKYDLRACRRNLPSKNMLGIIPSRSENSLFTLKQEGLVCLDVTALALSNEEIMKSISFLGNTLGHVYLSNVQRGIPYALPQKGILPIESFLTKLATQIRFRGGFTLRVDAHQLDEADESHVLERLKDCRRFFDEYFTNNVPSLSTAKKEIKSEES